MTLKCEEIHLYIYEPAGSDTMKVAEESKRVHEQLGYNCKLEDVATAITLTAERQTIEEI